MSGCRPSTKSAPGFRQVIGSRGHTSGYFNRPRGLVYDKSNGLLHVVDWDGRIQCFTLEGKFRGSWIMPEVEKGKPEDLWLTPEGTLLVTDTHYSRIIEFTTAGKEVRRFGRYGTGPGEFIYPVAVCMDADQFIYVSEYGEKSRIQKFTRTGEWVASIGRHGKEPGEFERPSGMAFGPDGLLYVADSVNHRIQVLTREGKVVRILGQQGAGPGEFRYPYDVDFFEGDLLVLEFGNQRVQRLTLEGKSLGVWGRAGRGDGEFASPWRFCLAENRLYVSDTNNNRVVWVNW